MTRKKSKQDTLIDELLEDCQDPKDILGKNGLLKQLTKRLVERTLEAELSGHTAPASLTLETSRPQADAKSNPAPPLP